MNGKKVLVLGATGAMGVYLVPELISMGYEVDAVSLDDVESSVPRLRYIKTKNAKDLGFLSEILRNKYDAIVDFMIYLTPEFKERYRLFLESTDHYIYLSTYRIYANLEHPIRETSPRLLDSATDPYYLASEDYSLYKARGENLLLASGKNNWTAVRPAITYSKRRFQLVTLEAPVVVGRTQRGKTILLPEEAMDVEATMSWAGDVACMLARLVLNPKAFGEIFSVCTSEHHTWRTIASYYEDLIDLKYREIPKEDYISILSGGTPKDVVRWQLELDRLYDRIMDNSKILSVTGLKQNQLTTLFNGLSRELSALPSGYIFPFNKVTEEGMDRWLIEHN